MKRIGLGLLTIATVLVFSSCKKNSGSSGEDSSYPTDNLVVDKDLKVMVMEHTGAWCQYCPNGAESLLLAMATYPGQVVAFARHTASSGPDPLESPVAGTLGDNFPVSGVPSFHVMGTEVSPDNVVSEIQTVLSGTSTIQLGVNHSVVETDSSYNVYPLVEFFENSTEEAYFIQSYQLLESIEAKQYASSDLNQVSSLSKVKTGSGAQPTRWMEDAAIFNGTPLIKAGDTYTHDMSLWMTDQSYSDWGYPLAQFAAFGNIYMAGDLIGSKHTPIVVSIPKVDVSEWDTHSAFMTIIWRLNADSGLYEYVNGVVTRPGF